MITCTWRGWKCDICCQCIDHKYRTTWDLQSFSWSGRCFITNFRCTILRNNFRKNSRISHTIKLCSINIYSTYNIVFQLLSLNLGKTVDFQFSFINCLSMLAVPHFGFENPSFHIKKHILVLVLSVVNWHVFSVFNSHNLLAIKHFLLQYCSSTIIFNFKKDTVLQYYSYIINFTQTFKITKEADTYTTIISYIFKYFLFCCSGRKKN